MKTNKSKFLIITLIAVLFIGAFSYSQKVFASDVGTHGIILAQKGGSSISNGGLLDPASGTCPANPKSLGDFVSYLICMINRAILPLLITACVAFFLFGILKFFFLNPGDEKKREEGKQFMIWGILALTVIMTLWGFVGFFKRTFFGPSPIAIPQLETVK